MTWKQFKRRAEESGLNLSDRVSRFVGTWTFVFLYTVSMAIWIGLHLSGILHIDSEDFMKWNLWLSYFAGTQASIVLMSSSRQAYLDRKKQDENMGVDIETLKATKKTAEKIQQLAQNIEMIEEVIEQFVEEQKKDDAEE